MHGHVLIGIDLGTTVLKACAVDARTGKTIGQSGQRLPVAVLPDGGREQDVGALDRAFARVMRDLREQASAAWRRVSGIGLAAQGGSTIIADRVLGAPHTPMLLWNDARGSDELPHIAARVSQRFWHDHMLLHAPPMGLGRLRWLQRTRPDLFRDANIHIGAGEHLFFKLTGVWRQDAGNAIQIGSYNAVAKQLDSAAFDLIGLPLSFVAPLRRGHETAPLSKHGAQLLGLPEGIPVAGPYIDQEAGYLSAAGVGRPLQCSLGTAWVGNFTLPDDTTGASPFQLVLPAPVGQGRLVVQPLLTGNVTWDWGLTTLIDPSLRKALVRAAAVFKERLLPPRGLIALPWCTQRNPLHPAQGGGGLLGISPRTTRDDLLRALAAGMACELARVFYAVNAAGAIDRVVLGGGAGKGSYFRELIAALFAPTPVLWQIDSDLATARGAVFAFSPEAAQAPTQPVPAPDGDVHDTYACYLTAFAACCGNVPEGGAFTFT